MEKLKKFFIIILLLIFVLILSANLEIFASNTSSSGQEVQYSEKYQKWLELSNEEKQNVIQPRMYDVPYTKIKPKNPLLKANMLRATINEPFTLQSVIPDNLIIKDQQQTGSCWAFAALSSLETNLALANIKNATNTSKVYDFSERHMEYATSRVFENNEINSLGYNRTVGSGGNWNFASSYLTNGMGAIDESEMKFINDESTINIDAIQGKTVTSHVYDTVEFPDYNDTIFTETEANDIKNQVKHHIQNYGSVFGSVKSGSFAGVLSPVSDTTGALAIWGGFADHAVSIVGWDDNYAVSNWDEFDDYEKPTNPGAWIVRNSWGTGHGKNGYIYVSYEDENISESLSGIIKATDNIDYNNIYQYDYYYPNYQYLSFEDKVMICNVFTKETNKTEYLTQVSLHIPEASVCRVYVNPTGAEKTKDKLQPVLLKAGESETFNNVGYHTLEFANPIEITSNQFAVAIEITSNQGSNYVSCVESTSYEESPYYSVVEIQTGKCFILDNYGQKFNDDYSSYYDYDWSGWEDLGTKGNHPSNSTIKAFTTNGLIDESLKNIEITTSPTKTKYWAGEDFDKSGMVVKANYNDGTSVVLENSDYSITNGTNLQVGQTSVTITFEDKTIEQTIEVVENKLENITITNPPKKTEYWAGEDFDKTEMIVKAEYTDKTTVEVTDYEITNGTSLKNGQKSIIVSYQGKTAEQDITVKENSVVKIEITKVPDKVDYVVGQNFNKAGMIVKATYANGTIKEITNYEVKDGKSLSEGQTTVTISYEQQTATQAITVVAKAITEINVKTKPTKTKYIQNKEDLDLTGGVIEIKYNDATTENIEMTSDEVSATGFSNSKLGTITITLSYQSKTTQYDVEIIEETIVEENAENSKMDNAVANVKKVKAYYFTDDSQKDYALIDVEVKGIEKSLKNDKMEYYYFLSSNKNEENITDWIKVTENQDNNSLKFTIDSNKIDNYNKISNADVLYLYVKEVATKGGSQSISICKAMAVETDKNIEIYIDNVKKENISSGDNVTNKPDGSKDDTVADGDFPNTGSKTFVIISVIILVAIICVFCYKKYNWFRDIK